MIRVGVSDPAEVTSTIHAFVVLLVVEPLIRTRPLERVAELLGCRLDLSPGRPDAAPLRDIDLSLVTQRHLRASRRVTGSWPFSKGPCLRRALVGGHLIRRLAPSIRLGFDRRENDELFAHAWLEIEGRPLEDISELQLFAVDERAIGA